MGFTYISVMTMSDLILLSLGAYQIKQARFYYGEHIRQHGTFKIEFAEVENENVPMPNQTEGFLISGRIKSRHTSGKNYYTIIYYWLKLRSSSSSA